MDINSKEMTPTVDMVEDRATTHLLTYLNQLMKIVSNETWYYMGTTKYFMYSFGIDAVVLADAP